MPERILLSDNGRHIGVTVKGQMRLGNLGDGSVHSRLARTGHTDIMTAFSVSANGKLIATASDDRTVGLWRAKSGRFLSLIEGFASPVFCLKFDRTGTRLLTLDKSGHVTLWRVAKDTKDPYDRLAIEAKWTRRLKIGPRSPQSMLIQEYRFPGDGEESNSISLVAVVVENGKVILIELSMGQKIALLDSKTGENLECIAMDSNSTRLVGGSSDGRVIVVAFVCARRLVGSGTAVAHQQEAVSGWLISKCRLEGSDSSRDRPFF